MSVDGLGNLASIWIPGNLGLQELVHTTAASKGLVIDPAIAVSAAILVKALMLAHGAFCGLLWLGLEPFDPPSAP
jgi:hypothetical protein